jgi:hypothetical protein
MYSPDQEREHQNEHEDQKEHESAQPVEEIELPAAFLKTGEDAGPPPEAASSPTTAIEPDSGAAAQAAAIEEPKSPKERLLAFVKQFRERLEGRKQDHGGTLTAKSRITQDRTRITVAIAGASILAILIFLVTFTRPATIHKVKEERAHPNLGRPENSETADGRSGVPLRSAAGVKPEDRDGRLSDQDILNTSKLKPRSHRTPAASHQDDKDYAVNKIPFPKEGEAAPSAPAAPQPEKYQASLVFVRNAGNERNAASPSAQPVPAADTPVVMSAFFSALPPGTRLVARLESPVSTALKNTPAVAAIEYNYTRDGEVVIPAGSKAFGKLSSANEHGMVELGFDTIELPDGTRQKIDGFGESLTYQPIKGTVTGRNIGLQFLVQSLTGVGSIAAATVGARSGTGINDSLSNNAILRERLSENIATAGQNQMSSLAYRQNIVVTVPGNTRFYLVLNRNDKGREGIESTPASRPIPSAAPGAPSVENVSMETRYLQELEGLKRQLDQLSKQQQPASDPGTQPAPLPPPQQ